MPFLLVGGSISEFIGRKPTLIIGQSIIILGWISVYFANSFPILLFGRLVGGIGCGLNLPVTTLLLSEIALINMRGILSMMSLLGIISNEMSIVTKIVFQIIYLLISTLAINVGWLYSLIMGILPLNMLIIISAVPSILFLSVSYFLPESPLWLIKGGHADRAKQSLLQLRGPEYSTYIELAELDGLVKSEDDTKWTDKLKELKMRENAIPLIINATIAVIQVCS